MRTCKMWRRQARDVDFTETKSAVTIVPIDGVRRVRREPPLKGEQKVPGSQIPVFSPHEYK